MEVEETPNITSSGSGTTDAVQQAAIAISTAMGSEKHAIVNDAACIMLGSDRSTQVVDFVVPRNNTIAARRRLRDSAAFTIEPRTNYTHHGTVEIRILTPPLLFRQRFHETTSTMLVSGAHVLKPSLVLNAKCRAISNEFLAAEKDANAEDVVFLLRYLASNRIRVSAMEVSAATKGFVSQFVQEYGGEEFWVAAGFNLDRDDSLRDEPVLC